MYMYVHCMYTFCVYAIHSSCNSQFTVCAICSTYVYVCMCVCVCVCFLQATVAAFAASEGQGHPRIVEIEKVIWRNYNVVHVDNICMCVYESEHTVHMYMYMYNGFV